MTAPVTLENLTCPVPLTEYDRVLLGHGSGGKLTAELIQRLFLPELGNEILAAMEDQATVSLADPSADGATLPQLAFTTDSFVVRPLFFPGGDIGKLAVHGTVNDLAVGGATPLFLSAAFILEEGLPMDDLRRIVASMHAACDEAGVQLVTGDTKVVDRGKGDRRVHHHVRHRPACRPADGCRFATPGRATEFSSPARSATTESRSCPSARESNSRRSWKATPLR